MGREASGLGGGRGLDRDPAAPAHGYRSARPGLALTRVAVTFEVDVTPALARRPTTLDPPPTDSIGAPCLDYDAGCAPDAAPARAASGTDPAAVPTAEAFACPSHGPSPAPADWWLRCAAEAAAPGATSWPATGGRRLRPLLDEDLDTIRAAADRLEREALSAEADTLGRALRLDLLTADDFR